MENTVLDPTHVINFVLVSNFNLANLAAHLNKDADLPLLKAECAPFGQVIQTLMDPGRKIWRPDTRGAVVWTSPESVSAAFGRLLRGERVDTEELISDVKSFCEAVKAIPREVSYVFVPNWVTGAFEGRLGLLDLDVRSGNSLALLRMNLALAENLGGDSRIFVLDASRWMLVHGQNSLSASLWYMAKTPYSFEFLKVAALELKAAMRALRGQARKLLVLDLDDTLWGGVVGDLGWENVRLGGHDPIGEAFQDFQVALKTLKQRGILLAISSKNEEGIALEALDSNPEMILRRTDFCVWRINWQDKARNIVELTSELNLGLQSVVFIDDNPVERARVREALPDVLVPEWPDSPLHYKTALQMLRCFDQAQFTIEDGRRSTMYMAERMRQEALQEVGSLDSWLKGLEVQVTAEPIKAEDLDRVAQLFNKTNQMNLSTRRMTKEEIWIWSQEPKNALATVRVSDKFGDYGLVGIASFTLDLCAGGEAALVDFLLSCRAMGRKVEDTMLHFASLWAKAKGANSLCARYCATAKNQPCLRFFEGLGLPETGTKHIFRMELANALPLPESVQLICRV